MPVTVLAYGHAMLGADVSDQNSGLLRLPLHDVHLELGGKMVGFAGYDMPVQYPMGVMGEHLHTRAKAGLFDVSHMGQILAYPIGTMEELALDLERLMPIDVAGLAPWHQRYGMLTNDAGGILDDLMIAHRGDHFLIVVNAACKAADFAHLQAHLRCAKLTMCSDRALLALQGPLAEAALAQIIPETANMRFMQARIFGDFWVSRSGYTGEDGFEIYIPRDHAEPVFDALVAAGQPEGLKLAGLGCRDTLRLEARLALYGQDIDDSTTPVQAGLSWVVGWDKSDFIGRDALVAERAVGPARVLRGFVLTEKGVMRHGYPIFDGERQVGEITSGSVAPTLGSVSIGLGYVEREVADREELLIGIRDRRVLATVTKKAFYSRPRVG